MSVAAETRRQRPHPVRPTTRWHQWPRSPVTGETEPAVEDPRPARTRIWRTRTRPPCCRGLQGQKIQLKQLLFSQTPFLHPSLLLVTAADSTATSMAATVTDGAAAAPRLQPPPAGRPPPWPRSPSMTTDLFFWKQTFSFSLLSRRCIRSSRAAAALIASHRCYCYRVVLSAFLASVPRLPAADHRPRPWLPPRTLRSFPPCRRLWGAATGRSL